MSDMDTLDLLEEEHQSVTEKLALLERAIGWLEEIDQQLELGTQAVAEMRRYLADEFRLHVAHEEDVLLPVLEETPGAPQALLPELRSEHRELEDLAVELIRKVQAFARLRGPWSAARDELSSVAWRFYRLLDQHKDKEDREVFPAARRLFGAAQCEELARRLDELQAPKRPREGKKQAK